MLQWDNGEHGVLRRFPAYNTGRYHNEGMAVLKIRYYMDIICMFGPPEAGNGICDGLLCGDDK